MNSQQSYIVSFTVLGIVVMMTYALYWPAYDMWAGLNARCAFCLWSISALLSAVGFLNLTFKLIFDETSDEVHTWTILPYSLFLFASALYMPFASNKYILSTLFVLLAAAVSACVLVYASSLLYGWGADTVLVLFLAVHCTVVDLCYWGSTWVNQLRDI